MAGVKIELSIKRAGGTVVDFPRWPSENVPHLEAPAARYHFKPESPAENAPHVCEVAHPVHVQRLLSITGYRLAGEAEDLPLPAPNPAAASMPVAALTSAAPAPAANAEKVAEIRALPIRDLKATINTFTGDDLRAALVAENASPDGRKGFIEVVQAHLGEPAIE